MSRAQDVREAFARYRNLTGLSHEKLVEVISGLHFTFPNIAEVGMEQLEMNGLALWRYETGGKTVPERERMIMYIAAFVKLGVMDLEKANEWLYMGGLRDLDETEMNVLFPGQYEVVRQRQRIPAGAEWIEYVVFRRKGRWSWNINFGRAARYIAALLILGILGWAASRYGPTIIQTLRNFFTPHPAEVEILETADPLEALPLSNDEKFIISGSFFTKDFYKKPVPPSVLTPTPMTFYELSKESLADRVDRIEDHIFISGATYEVIAMTRDGQWLELETGEWINVPSNQSLTKWPAHHSPP